MPFRLGGVLALIAVTLLAIAIAAMPWWKGHPTVDGKEIAAFDVDVGLFGGQRCNTGGDGTCSKLPLGGGFKTVEGLEAGAIIATMVFGLALAAFAFLSLGPRRLVSRLLIGGGMATALFAIVLLAIGPDVHVSQSVTIPTAPGAILGLLGGVLGLVGGVLGGRDESAPKRRTMALPEPYPGAPSSVQQGYDMQALLREDSLRPSQASMNSGQAPLFSSAPQLRPLYEMPGGGFVPPQPPPMPMRAPTPIARHEMQELGQGSYPVLPPNAPTAAAPPIPPLPPIPQPMPSPPPPSPFGQTALASSSPFGQTGVPVTKTNANLSGSTSHTAGSAPLPPPRPGMKTQPPPPRRIPPPPGAKATTIGPPLPPPTPPLPRNQPVPTPPPLSMPTPPPMLSPPDPVIPRGNLIDEDDPDSISISQPVTRDDASSVGDMTDPNVLTTPAPKTDGHELATDRASAALSSPPDMPMNAAPPVRSSMPTIEEEGPRTESSLVVPAPHHDDDDDAETPPPVLVPASGAYGAPLRAASPLPTDRPSFVLTMSVAGAPATPPSKTQQPDTVPPVNNEVGAPPSMPPVAEAGVGPKGIPVAPPGSPTMAIPVPKFPLTTAGDLPPPKPAPMPVASSGPSPACPQCESPMTWVEEHLRFYCKSCKMYF